MSFVFDLAQSKSRSGALVTLFVGLLLALLESFPTATTAFVIPSSCGPQCLVTKNISKRPMVLFADSKKSAGSDEDENLGPKLGSAPLAGSSTVSTTSSTQRHVVVEEEKEEVTGAAATGTVNERLLAELEEAARKEKYGARSNMGKKLGLDSFRSRKTDEERKAAIEEARNLNGINPAVALAGSAFALTVAAGLWFVTNSLAEYFALHPIETEVYFIGRSMAVMRNVVIGLVTLASGFFGVTGLGIFLLGVRVAYGVISGELDPTPIKTKVGSQTDESTLANMWDLMLNKRPSRRNRDRKDNDNNPFGS